VTLPDVNVLISAFRPEAKHHTSCIAWLERVINKNESFGLSRLALSAVVRITTNRKIYSPAETASDAFAYCDSLLSRPNCITVEPGPNHWAIFRRLCIEHNILGKDVADAYYAALAIEHGCEWVTLDRDFGKFKGLKWKLLK
jgi:uncharacterized protein